MNFEELLRQSCDDPGTKPTEIEIRRNLRRFERLRLEYQANGTDPTAGLDVGDPLRLLNDEEARMAWQAEVAGLATFTWNATTKRLLWSNQMSAILGYEPGQMTPSADRFFERVHHEDEGLVRRELARAWAEQMPTQVEHRVVIASGEVRHLQCVVEVLVDNMSVPIGLVGTVQDITETVQNRRALERANRRLETMLTVVGESLADRDPHTRLFNRRRFVGELEHELRQGPGGVLLIGLEGLRDINDRQGHEVGDDVLLTVAKMIGDAVRPTDVVARIGGHEFAVLLGRTSRTNTLSAAQKLLHTLRTPVLAAAHQPITSRVGIVCFDASETLVAEDVLMDADQALYEAKDDDLTLFEAPPQRSIPATERRKRWQQRMDEAMRRDLFDLHAQPILDLTSNTVTRHELLLRLSEWNEPVTPSSFLPTAERLGTIVALDRYVIERAIDLVAADKSNTQFHINLSGRSVCEPRLLDFVDNLVRSRHADPRRLTFEITETALISNMTAARRFADGLRQMQCQLALDDFGSGYASLAHLKYLPFDVVKIDGDLIGGILDNAADKIMVRSLANMCSQLGIHTVAEFVSDEQTLAALSSYGVDFAQGFAVGRPVPTAEIEIPDQQAVRDIRIA